MLKAAIRDRIVKDVKPHGVLAELHVPLSDYKLAGWNKEVAHALKVQNLLAPVQQSACTLVRGVEEVRNQATRSRHLDRLTHTLSEPSPEMILARRLVTCNEDAPTVSDDGGARGQLETRIAAARGRDGARDDDQQELMPQEHHAQL